MTSKPVLPTLSGNPDLDDIRETAKAIAAFVHRTPVFSSSQINDRVGAELFFKCENFQRVGAFKMRGAASAALRLENEVLSRGLCTHSSGNHAQAVARAASILEVPAFIVMPENAPAIKRKATAGYGAQIITCGPTQSDRESKLEEVVRQTGAHFIHPYDDPHVIAGQGTAALELWEDAGPFDVVWTPVGGGGLLSGTAIAITSLGPQCEVYGGEPEGANDAARSFHSGRLCPNEQVNTIADGLRTNLSERTFGIIRHKVRNILTVDDDAIVSAMRLVWERMKIVIEPSCAVPLAAILKNREHWQGKRLGVILSGGNVDLDNLPWS